MLLQHSFSDLLIVEQVHGQFLIEGKLLDTLPAIEGILGTNSMTFNKIFHINNLASDKTISLDLYQLQTLQSDHHIFICSIVSAKAVVLSSLRTLSLTILNFSTDESWETVLLPEHVILVKY